jgi:hypothetical protein
MRRCVAPFWWITTHGPLAHPENGVLVEHYYGDVQNSSGNNDTSLAAVAHYLQHELEHLPDVRPTLERKFGLRLALEAAVTAANASKWRGPLADAQNNASPPPAFMPLVTAP